MTISIQDGAIIIQEGSRKSFDTNDKLFHVVASKNGSTGQLAYLNQPNVTYQLNDYISLGSVSTVCTQVIGAVRIRLAAGSYSAGLAFNRWHTVMGGSIVWVHDGEPGVSKDLGSNFGAKQSVTYWFEIVNGNVRLRRRVFLADTPLQYVVKAHILDYKLKCGVWV